MKGKPKNKKDDDTSLTNIVAKVPIKVKQVIEADAVVADRTISQEIRRTLVRVYITERLTKSKK